MRLLARFTGTLVLLSLCALLVRADPQAPAAPPAAAPATPPPPAPPPSVPATPPPSPTAVAATVNGQPIMEIAVYRGLQRLPPEGQAKARPELVNFLIDNALIDQYLVAAKINVDTPEIEAGVKRLQEDVKKQGMTFEELMKRFLLTEAELRKQIADHLRWEKFIDAQAGDKALRDLFDRNQDLFDGSMVRARHILITPSAGDPQSIEQSRVKAASLKKQIEDTANQAIAKEPPGGDALAQSRARSKAVEEAFTLAASKESMCPSKQQGGDLGYFPRSGNMVEPFAKAAFALQPNQISDPVATQFGLHLILVTERKQGKPVKYEEVKDEVKDVFAERMRDALLAQLRPQAKVVIHTPPK
jgi:parvulin-like peptidyl-prolyl isomerase